VLAQERIIDPNKINDESVELTALRPQKLDDFIGQSQLKDNLKIFIDAAKTRGEALDHVLFYGPPGLGKTTLSQIISRELGVGFKSTSGPIITKTGDLAAILTSLQKDDILFIDEIHRLSTAVEEVLYSAMEDFHIDLVIGEGPAARTVKINLQPFTLVGATTRLGLLTNPLRDRFGIPLKLDFYSPEELKQVISRSSKILGISIENAAATELAKSSRGTPRIANRLLKRVRDFAQVEGKTSVTLDVVLQSLKKLGVDNLGLDAFDHRYLQYILEHYNAGPVGIETIAAGLSEDRDTIEDTIEPYLMQIGFISRTPRGRMLTQNAIKHISNL
jgi:holliday junction DNA helicase RuvB